MPRPSFRRHLRPPRFLILLTRSDLRHTCNPKLAAPPHLCRVSAAPADSYAYLHTTSLVQTDGLLLGLAAVSSTRAKAGMILSLAISIEMGFLGECRAGRKSVRI